MRKLWLLSLLAFTLASLFAQNPTGTWQGALKAGGRELRIVFKITRADDESLKAQLFSLDQGGQPMPVSSVKQNGAAITIKIDAIGGAFEGALNKDATTLTGNWTQGPSPIPLAMARATPETAWTIPEPTPPPKPMDPAANPSFDVATIKPSRPNSQGRMFRLQGGQVAAYNTSLSNLISFAYDVHERQIIAGAPWMESDKFDITGKPDVAGQPNLAQMKIMMQKLLAERFQLKFHRDKRELSVFTIVIPPKSTHKLTLSQSGGSNPGLMFPRLGMLPARNATMAEFAQVMQGAVFDRPVVDKTGLDGRFDFTLNWTPDEFQFGNLGGIRPGQIPDTGAPNIFKAFQEQLGLKLEAAKAPADVLVIDRSEKPSEN